MSHRIITPLLLLLSLTATEEALGLIPNQSFFKKKAGMASLREDHYVSRLSGAWCNVIFTEFISLVMHDSLNNRCPPNELPVVWGTALLYGSSNFWCVAKNCETGEFVDCYYEISEQYYNVIEDSSGNIVRYEWVNPDICNWSRCYIKWDESFQPRLFLCYVFKGQYSYTWRATVPEGVEIKLYFGTDLFSVHRNGELITYEGEINNGVQRYGWADYFNNGGLQTGVWAVSDAITVGDPQPPDDPPLPPPGEVYFVEYLRINAIGDTVNGNDWLPDPTDNDSLIGLVFTCTDSADSVAENRIVYEMFDITSWNGMCMNDLSQYRSYPTGDGRNFDFYVHNPDYGIDEPKYTIIVHDYDQRLEVRNEPRGMLLSTRRYTIERNDLVKGDTLWLIAKDFGAHAVILPRGMNCHMLRLRGRTNPYYQDEPIWSVTVPRDYDGVQTVGLNRGDFMADQYEESVFGLAFQDTMIKTFYPFILTDDSTGQFILGKYADQDSFPTGRGIDGDGFSNWEEYRGFYLKGDLTSPQFSTPKYIRLDPRHKNVMVGWRDQLNIDIINNFPAWFNLLDKPNFDTADTLQHLDIYFVKTFLMDGERDSLCGREINWNKCGASFFYYGYEHTTTAFPSPYYQSAVTFWELNRSDRRYMDRLDILAAGAIFCYPRDIPFAIPNRVKRIVLNLPMIRSWGNAEYYTQGPGIWLGVNGDYNKMLKYIMTHEFGHSVGMLHSTNLPKTIMWGDGGPIDFNGDGQCFYDPAWLLDFSTSDKDSTTVNDSTRVED